MFYNTGVTNELVQKLGLSDKTPPGLPGFKPSSNSVLPVAWITRPAMDLRPYMFLLGPTLSLLILRHFPSYTILWNPFLNFLIVFHFLP